MLGPSYELNKPGMAGRGFLISVRSKRMCLLRVWKLIFGSTYDAYSQETGQRCLKLHSFPFSVYSSVRTIWGT